MCWRGSFSLTKVFYIKNKTYQSWLFGALMVWTWDNLWQIQGHGQNCHLGWITLYLMTWPFSLQINGDAFDFWRKEVYPLKNRNMDQLCSRPFPPSFSQTFLLIGNRNNCLLRRSLARSRSLELRRGEIAWFDWTPPPTPPPEERRWWSETKIKMWLPRQRTTTRSS